MSPQPASAPGSPTGSLLAEIIEAHGGRERWLSSTELSVQVSAGGLAIASKLQRTGLRDLEARVSTDRPRLVFTPYPRTGYRGVFDQGEVRIETDQGGVIGERSDPRRALHSPRRLLRWDQLDLHYFGGSALWTYMATPFVFTEPGFHVQAGQPWAERGEQWRTLSVTFPADFHTHSRQQVFYVGDDGLIRRHDYTAEEFGHWAKSAHYWLDHHTFDGLVIPKQRRVFPRRSDNRAHRHPLLVWIDVRAVSLPPAPPGAMLDGCDRRA